MTARPARSRRRARSPAPGRRTTARPRPPGAPSPPCGSRAARPRRRGRRAGRRCVQRRHDQLRLRRRDDPVLEALEDDHRRADLVGVVDRRALAPQLLGLGPRADEPVVVARLELVRVVDEAASGRRRRSSRRRRRTRRVEGQRAEHGPAARAAAGDRHPRAVDLARRRPARGAALTASSTSTTPHGAAQPVAVLAAVAGAAAVVDVDDGEAAAGEELDLRAQASSVTCAVGPPWMRTSSGGRSPAGAAKSGLCGG